MKYIEHIVQGHHSFGSYHLSSLRITIDLVLPYDCIETFLVYPLFLFHVKAFFKFCYSKVSSVMEFVPGFIEHIEELLVDIIFDPKHNLTCYHYCPTQYEKIEL